jgi:hypothetical protein
VRNRDASGTPSGEDLSTPRETEGSADAIFPAQNEVPTRKFAAPPTLRGESTVHTAPTREFPAHVDPSEAFLALERAEAQLAAYVNDDKIRTGLGAQPGQQGPAPSELASTDLTKAPNSAKTVRPSARPANPGQPTLPPPSQLAAQIAGTLPGQGASPGRPQGVRRSD